MRPSTLSVAVLLCGLPHLSYAGYCDTANPVTLPFTTITADAPYIGCTYPGGPGSDLEAFAFRHDVNLGSTDLAAARLAALHSCDVTVKYWIRPQVFRVLSADATTSADVYVKALHWNGSSWQVVSSGNNPFSFTASDYPNSPPGADGIDEWIEEEVPVPPAALAAMTTVNDGFTIQSDIGECSCTASAPNGSNSLSAFDAGQDGTLHPPTLVYVPWIP